MSNLDQKKLSRLFNTGKYKKAIEYLEDFTDENPEDGKALAMLGFAYGHIPPEAIGEGKKSDWLDKSIETYKKSLEAEPESIDYMRGLGRVLWHRARVSDDDKDKFLKESLDVFENAYKKSDENPDILSFMINVKIDMDKIEEAKADLKKVAEEKESPYGAYLNAAFRFDESGESHLAKRYAEKALEIAEKEGRVDGAQKRLEKIAEA